MTAGNAYTAHLPSFRKGKPNSSIITTPIVNHPPPATVINAYINTCVAASTSP